MEPYIGEIRVVGFTFAPPGWLSCSGQSLPINQYDALYALIGTTYGGDGVNTFNLPDLRSRVQVGPGTGPGLSNYQLGQTGGLENVTLTVNQLPVHQHPFTATVQATTTGPAVPNPAGALPATSSNFYASQPTAGQTLNSALNTTTQPAGNSQPHTNIQPVLALNHIICVEGIYPSQS